MRQHAAACCWAVVLSASVVLLLAARAPAGWPVYQLTDNASDDTNPSASDGRIAWEHESAVHYWNGATTQVFHVGEVDREPSLYQHTLAWTSGSGSGPREVLYWYGTIIDWVSPAGVGDAETPSLFDGMIAWCESGDLVLWQDSGVARIPLGVKDPSLSADGLAYTQAKEVTPGVSHDFVQYINFNAVEVMELGQEHSGNATASDGAVAWEVDDGTSALMYWDGSGTRQIATGVSPSLYAGQVAFRASDGHDNEIFLWDGSDVIQITDNDVDDTSPSLTDGMIAWAGWDGNDYEIYYAVPEPATLALLALGGLALIRRRRRKGEK